MSDPKQMTLAELRSEIERLDAAATKGPWRVEDGGEFIVCKKQGITFDVATIPDCLRIGPNENSDQDGPFIAFSRTALPELLRRLIVAEEALAESRECLSGMTYSGPLQKSWMNRAEKSINTSTEALAEIRGNAEAERSEQSRF